jgi:hypothetical protein
MLFAAGRGACHAQVVVKQEPLDMRNGATVLVDDGSCGKGHDQALDRNPWQPDVRRASARNKMHSKVSRYRQTAQLAALAYLLAADGSCNARPVVKQEPFDGKMLPVRSSWWTTVLAAKAGSRR